MKKLLAFAIATAACTASFADLTVDFEVKNPAGASSTKHPVSFVVPLPEGAYQQTSGFRVMNASGAQVPAQFSALNRWWRKDNSIRNLHVNFVADLAGSDATTRFTLRDGATSQPGKALTVEETSGLITVVTGPLKFTLRKDSVRVVEQAWLDRDGDGSFEDDESMLDGGAERGAILTPTTGSPINAASLSDAKIEIEERGPVRAVIKVEVPTAPPGNPYGYKFRIYAWQGRPDLQIDYTLKNDILGPTGAILYFDDFSLQFKPRLDAASSTLRFGASLSGTAGSGARLLQSSATAFAATGSVAGTGDKSEGWMDMSQTGRGGLQIALRDAWQQFPKAFELDAAGRMAVRLWPAGGEDGAGMYWLGDMQYKTHSVFLRFHGDGENAAVSAEYGKLVNTPPAAVVPVAWYAQTRQPPGMLGVMHLKAPVTPYFEGPNFGDTLGWRLWWHNGRKSTIETGNTPQNWTGDMYMVSGDPKWLQRVVRWARHSADIRPTHLYGYAHPMSKSWQGFVAGGYGWQSWRKTFVPYTVQGTTWDNWFPYDDQHAWVHEMEWAYYYTGDRLFYDHLCNLGEIWKASLDMNAGKKLTVSPRALAWTFELVRIQHTLSGDAGALEMMAKAIDTTAIVNQNGFLGALNGDNLSMTFTQGTQTFQMGMIVHHMATLYRELPEGLLKRRLFGLLVGIGDYFTVHSWADDNRGIGRRPTEKTVPYYGNEDMGDAPALLYALTGRSDYKDKASRIASNLGTWWPDWKGGRPGRMVSYMLANPRTDTTPPAAIGDLQAYRANGRNDIVLLSWTSPADAKRFDVRGSPRTIVERIAAAADTATQVNWWNALAGAPPTGAPIQGRHWTLVKGTNITGWNFTVRSFDSDGDEANMSAMSNQVKPECCFNPDTLPTSTAPRKAPADRKLRLHKERQGWLQIDAPELAPGEVLEISLIGADGRQVANLGSFSRQRPSVSVDCSGFRPGLYWIKAGDGVHSLSSRAVLY